MDFGTDVMQPAIEIFTEFCDLSFAFYGVEISMKDLIIFIFFGALLYRILLVVALGDDHG